MKSVKKINIKILGLGSLDSTAKAIKKISKRHPEVSLDDIIRAKRYIPCVYSVMPGSRPCRKYLKNKKTHCKDCSVRPGISE